MYLKRNFYGIQFSFTSPFSINVKYPLTSIKGIIYFREYIVKLFPRIYLEIYIKLQNKVILI